MSLVRLVIHEHQNQQKKSSPWGPPAVSEGGGLGQKGLGGSTVQALCGWVPHAIGDVLFVKCKLFFLLLFY